MIPFGASPDKEELRRRLPLAYVCQQLGVTLNQEQRALCPLHHDTDPSFRLWQNTDGETLWWCDPCGVGGDIFELIMRVQRVSFPEALAFAQELLAKLPENYTPPAVSQVSREGPADWAAEVNEARARAEGQPTALSTWTNLVDSTDQTRARAWDRYIRSVWGWGVGEDLGVYMPHWDADGQLTGCKVRYQAGNRLSKRGSRYEALYGAWLGRRHREVLICEGETDAVYAGFTAREEAVAVDVFSLPSGASRPPSAENLAFLRDARTVYLAFDPDTAGVAATRTWLHALTVQPGGFDDVRVCSLPRGLDLRAARASVRTLLHEARKPLPPPEDLTDTDGGYVHVNSKGLTRLVCPWTLEPTAQLVGGDDPGFEVLLRARGVRRETTIKLSDLLNVSALRRWTIRHNLVFPGTDADVQRIATHLAARGSITPEVFQTDQVGLHDPPRGYEFAGRAVVYPDGYTGMLPWKYVPGTRSHDVTKRVLLPAEGTHEWSWLEDFLALSSTDVTHPLLAWLVAASRRTEVTQFPLLFIGGSSGVGKSTLARLALRLCGSEIELDLGANTAHILMRTLASSTTLPVFIDEWTLRSRRDTREALQGAIPVLYTGGRAERGQADLSAVVYHLTAPTIIAGEDTMTLDRELERTVRVAPARKSQNHAALRRIQDVPLELFGKWLHLQLTAQRLPAFSPMISDRVAYNRSVLEVGWRTLHVLLDDAATRDPDVPSLPVNPDLSALDREAEERSENVYELALAECAPLRDANGIAVVWTDPDGQGTWVRFQRIVGVIERHGIDVELPGRSRAIRDYFTERYGELREGRVEAPGSNLRRVRAHLIPGFSLGDESALATMIQREET